MSSTRSRVPGSGLAAMAAVAVIVLIWYVGSGNAPRSPQGLDGTLTAPDVDATPSAGQSAGSAPVQTDPDAVRIRRYVRLDDRRLELSYTTAPEACAGRLDTPRVQENDGAVVVTLLRVPPDDPPESCAEAELSRTVTIDLDSPLGGRGLLDGSFSPPVRVRPAD